MSFRPKFKYGMNLFSCQKIGKLYLVAGVLFFDSFILGPCEEMAAKAGVKRSLEEVAKDEPITLRIDGSFAENSSKYRLLKATPDVLEALKNGERWVLLNTRRIHAIQLLHTTSCCFLFKFTALVSKARTVRWSYAQSLRPIRFRR